MNKEKNAIRSYYPHADDEWFDEIRFIKDNNDKSIIKLNCHYRYKTSELSGDEWRVVYEWQIFFEDQWQFLENGIFTKLEDACKYLYSLIYNLTEYHKIMISSIDFYRKNTLIYRSTYNGKSLQLLHAIGHLPVALDKAYEDTPQDATLWKYSCFQPGCAEMATCIYEIKKEYCKNGHLEENKYKIYMRSFCRRHSKRGDCSLEDCDDNYNIIAGNPADPNPEDIVKAQRIDIYF